MEKSRLLSLFRSLLPKELRELEHFLTSPFHNKRLEVIGLFQFIKLNLSTSAVLSKENAFAAIAADRAYDDQQMRLWMSFLLKAIEHYLVHQSVFKDEVLAKTKLAEIYRLRNLPKQGDRQIRDLAILQDKQPYRNAAYYQADYQIEWQQYQITSANLRAGDLNLQKMLDNLDIAYFSEKLRQSSLALTHQKVHKADYKLNLLDLIIEHVEQHDLLSIPSIAAYYYSYQIISSANAEDYFPALKNTLVAHGQLFPQEELGDLYIFAINFCIKKYNEGDRQFLEDEFELFRKGIEQKLFIRNEVLSRYTYRNVVTVGLILEAYDWVDDFIHKYKEALPKNHRLSTFSFSLARLEYSRKNYDAALTLLQKSNYKEVLLNLSAKTVLLKIFFELKEFDLLDAQLVAMRTFIRRKKVMGYHQENYINLIRFLRKMIESNPYARAERRALRTEIEATKVVAEKEWLLEQIG